MLLLTYTPVLALTFVPRVEVPKCGYCGRKDCGSLYGDPVCN